MEFESGDTKANVDLVRAAFAAFNSGSLETCTEFITEDFIINIAGMPFQMRGRDAWMQNAQVMRSAFPNVAGHIEDIFSSGDRVAVRLTMTGTHEGEFLDIPATGRTVEYTSIEIYRIAGGLLAEEWISSDIATMMRQLTEPSQTADG
ncbi:MAG TPA: ester cyclase [Actinoplanes sp.]|jgi:steroid delta-isomerase-like uncharacterized protein